MKRLTFPGPKHNENFTKAAITNPNGLVSDWPEKCGKPLEDAFSRFFLVPPPGQVKTFLNKKNYTFAREQAFI